MPVAFRIIPEGDLDIENHAFVELSADVPEQRLQWIRQKLQIRFSFFLGEWFMDLRQGVPYYRDVFGKNPNLDVIQSLFQRIILTTEGVRSLASYSQRLERAERRLYPSFEAITDSGPLIVREDADFIVDMGSG